jgi:ribosomal protein S18 acetylase RimI-like enzyme
MTGFRLRPTAKKDMAEMVGVINANALAVTGTPWALIDRLGRLRQTKYVPPNAERVVAVTPDDQIVGYQSLASEAPYLTHEVGGAVHPAYRGRGIGTMLLHWAEQRALARLPLTPPAAQVVLYGNIFEGDDPAHSLLSEEGYRQARQWVHLLIELNGPPPPPVWPDGVTVRLLDPQHDWPLVGPALAEAFADHWGAISEAVETASEEEGDDSDLDDPDDPYFNSPGLCFVAQHGDQVIGSCLCNARHIEWPETGRVGSLSVIRPYRRQGIGQALLYHAFGEFYRRGVRRIVTDTDAASFTGAPRLYQRVGMRIFRRENLYQKIIRPGQDLRILSIEELS